jgi:hypothetical protein
MGKRKMVSDIKKPNYEYGKPLTFFEAQLFSVIYKFCHRLSIRILIPLCNFQRLVH